MLLGKFQLYPDVHAAKKKVCVYTFIHARYTPRKPQPASGPANLRLI